MLCKGKAANCRRIAAERERERGSGMHAGVLGVINRCCCLNCLLLL